jgi:hypothetical protein
MDHDLHLNGAHASGCTTLAWYIMAKKREYGKDQKEGTDGEISKILPKSR